MREITNDRYIERRLVGDERLAKEFVYWVTGRGEFPYDMLRHDKAYPARSEDATKLYANQRGLRSIKLIAARKPEVARWFSFGWAVSRSDFHPISVAFAEATAALTD